MWRRGPGIVQICPMQSTNPQPRPGRFLRIPEACAYIGVSRSRLYQLLAEGKLPARKLGCRTLLDKDMLDRFLEELPEAVFRPPAEPRKPRPHR